MGFPGYKNPSLSGQLATTVPTACVFTRSGNLTSGSYLQVGSVISSTTGFPIRINDGVLSFVSIQNENQTTFSVEIIEWDGTTETVLATLPVTSDFGGDFTPTTEIPVTFGNSLRVRVASGSCKNAILLAYVVGDVPV